MKSFISFGLLFFILLLSCSTGSEPGVALPGLGEVSGLSGDVFQYSVVPVFVSVENRGSASMSGFKLLFSVAQEGVKHSLLSAEEGKISAGGSFSGFYETFIPLSLVGDFIFSIELFYQESVVDKKEFAISIGDIPQEAEPNDSRFVNAASLVINRGLKGAISSEFDEDWFFFSLDDGKAVGLLLDGGNSAVVLDLYRDSDGNSFQQFTDDDFSGELVMENHSGESRRIYFRVSSIEIQNYWIILKERS